MFKKTLATALLAAAVPAVASASWFFSTQAMNAGGTINTRNMSGQTVADNAVFKQYTTSAGIPVTVTAATGYTIKSVTVNGVTATGPASVYNTTIKGSYTDKSVSAVFVVNGVKLTASMTNGNVTPTAVGNLTYGYDLKDPLVFTFSPKPGYKLTGVTGVPGADPNGKKPTTSAVPTAANQKMTVTFPKGYVFTDDSVTGIEMSATAVNTVIGLNPMLPQTVVIGKDATLTAAPNDNLTLIGGLSYNWNFVSGPANTLKTVQGGSYENGRLTSTTEVKAGPDTVAIATPTAATTTVTGLTVPGQYKFTLDVTAGGKTYTSLAVVNVVNSSVNGAYNTCQFCHTSNNVGGTWNADNTVKQTSKQYIYDNWSSSVHHKYACYQCHRDANAGGHPGTVDCSGCHHGTDYAKPTYPQARPVPVPGSEGTCAHCHAADSQNTHAFTAAAVQAKVTAGSCISCHDVAAPQHKLADATDGVGDNNGVRAIVGEFQKWSHHVTGVELNDAHCAACHMEGTVSGSTITINPTYHMVDAKTHLRDTTAGTDFDFAWNPAAPNHAGMDKFCMSCHDANGAVSPESTAIQGLINAAGKYNTGKTAGPQNPFGDTISNRYDKMLRPAVVDVAGQFDTTNNSHHAVSGARYTGRTRAAGLRQIASAATFAANSSASLYGVRSTIYDAGNFNALYVPLGTDGTAATGLGDDSTLHCGDCHTVGQWAPGVATNGNGELNTVAIGAHGSNNEYMLRNSAGTDERHRQNTAADVPAAGMNVPDKAALLVCFNCHNFTSYGSLYAATGEHGGPHAGEYANGGRCNGPGNTLSFAGYTTGVGTDGFTNRLDGKPNNLIVGLDASKSEAAPDFGNIFGIQCSNCHNSGVENGYGGIHGSKINTYTDGMGNTTKMERFLPGLGNSKYVPGILGGITGGTTASVTIPANTRSKAAQFSFDYTTGGVSNDTNWEQKASTPNDGTPGAIKNAEGKSAQGGAGCYTLSETSTAATFDQKGQSVDGGATTPNAFGTWGGCDDHGAPQGGGDHGMVKKIVRPITY